MPKSRLDYWRPKLTRNQLRDEKAINELQQLGWNVAIVWECETKNIDEIEQRLKEFLGPSNGHV